MSPYAIPFLAKEDILVLITMAFITRMSMIVQVKVVLSRTVVDND